MSHYLFFLFDNFTVKSFFFFVIYFPDIKHYQGIAGQYKDSPKSINQVIMKTFVLINTNQYKITKSKLPWNKPTDDQKWELPFKLV